MKACVRLWKNSAGQDKKTALRKENGSYFCTAQNRNTACTAHHLLWLPSIPAVTSAGLYVHFHLSLQLQAEGRQRSFYHACETGQVYFQFASKQNLVKGNINFYRAWKAAHYSWLCLQVIGALNKKKIKKLSQIKEFVVIASILHCSPGRCVSWLQVPLDIIWQY